MQIQPEFPWESTCLRTGSCVGDQAPSNQEFLRDTARVCGDPARVPVRIRLPREGRFCRESAGSKPGVCVTLSQGSYRNLVRAPRAPPRISVTPRRVTGPRCRVTVSRCGGSTQSNVDRMPIDPPPSRCSPLILTPPNGNTLFGRPKDQLKIPNNNSEENEGKMNDGM